VAGCDGYCGHTASFIGFAPADDPQIVVGVFVQGLQGANYSGGPVAAPVFTQVMSFALQEQRIPPTGAKAPNLPTTW